MLTVNGCVARQLAGPATVAFDASSNRQLSPPAPVRVQVSVTGVAPISCGLDGLEVMVTAAIAGEAASMTNPAAARTVARQAERPRRSRPPPRRESTLAIAV